MKRFIHSLTKILINEVLENLLLVRQLKYEVISQEGSVDSVYQNTGDGEQHSQLVNKLFSYRGSNSKLYRSTTGFIT